MLRIREERMSRVFVDKGSELTRLDNLFGKISKKYNMNYDNILELLKRRVNFVSIPAEIFNNILSPLENVVIYLHLIHGMNQTQISELLNRDHTTIWTTLNKANKKIKKIDYLNFIEQTKGETLVPLDIFKNRKYSILESLSGYLKNKLMMSYHNIALLTGKNDRTIWTVVNRMKNK